MTPVGWDNASEAGPSPDLPEEPAANEPEVPLWFSQGWPLRGFSRVRVSGGSLKPAPGDYRDGDRVMIDTWLIDGGYRHRIRGTATIAADTLIVILEPSFSSQEEQLEAINSSIEILERNLHYYRETRQTFLMWTELTDHQRRRLYARGGLGRRRERESALTDIDACDVEITYGEAPWGAYFSIEGEDDVHSEEYFQNYDQRIRHMLRVYEEKVPVASTELEDLLARRELVETSQPTADSLGTLQQEILTELFYSYARMAQEVELTFIQVRFEGYRDEMRYATDDVVAAYNATLE